MNILVGPNVGHLRHQLLLHGHDEIACRAYILQGRLIILFVGSGDWNLFLSALCLLSGKWLRRGCLQHNLAWYHWCALLLSTGCFFPTCFQSPGANRFFCGF